MSTSNDDPACNGVGTYAQRAEERNQREKDSACHEDA
jgi:hypothetical protein